jgi:DnaJ-class molecular chaperone
VSKFNQYFEYFGLPVTATLDDLRKAYRSLAKKLHPDVNKTPEAHEKFTQLQSAYSALTEYIQKGRRATYNRHYVPKRKNRKEPPAHQQTEKTVKKAEYTKEQLERLRVATEYLDNEAFRLKYNNDYRHLKNSLKKLKIIQYTVMVVLVLLMFMLKKEKRFLMIIVIYAIPFLFANKRASLAKKFAGHDQLMKDVAELIRRRRRKSAD